MALLFNTSKLGTNKRSSSLTKRIQPTIYQTTNDYYQFLKIQPGVSFFQTLTETKYPIGTLSLNLPAMYIKSESQFILKTSNCN